jgi:hypothetical protein
MTMKKNVHIKTAILVVAFFSLTLLTNSALAELPCSLTYSDEGSTVTFTIPFVKYLSELTVTIEETLIKEDSAGKRTETVQKPITLPLKDTDLIDAMGIYILKFKGSENILGTGWDLNMTWSIARDDGFDLIIEADKGWGGKNINISGYCYSAWGIGIRDFLSKQSR